MICTSSLPCSATMTSLFLCFIISLVLATHHVHALRRFSLQVRGGATTVQSAVGVLVIGRDDGSSTFVADQLPSWLTTSAGTALGSSSCFLFGDEHSSRPLFSIPDLPLDDSSAESLALLCDNIIVVIATPTEEGNRKFKEILPSLIKGVNQRRAAPISSHLPRGRLLIVSPSESLCQEIKATTATATTWNNVDIVTLEGFKDYWENNIQSSGGTVSTLFPTGNNALPFVKLLQKVYQQSRGRHQHLESPSKELSLNPIIPDQLPKVDGKTEKDGTQRSDSVTDDTREDYSRLVQEALTTAQNQLEALERKMDEIMLSDQPMPLLEFGTLVDDILNGAYQQLSGVPTHLCRPILERLIIELQRLYKDQLQTLRNFYGKRYETTLESHPDDEGEWTTAAEYATQGFQAAAKHAVPALCRVNGELADYSASGFDHVNLLQGLIKDMMEATQLKKDEQSLAFEDDEDEVSMKTRRVPRWLEKLAARVFVLGVNYFQGWLAWQGVKRAALERDRNMPKFPLF